jgi:hypothetical protein
MYINLLVHNPSPYPRTGFVATSWTQIANELQVQPRNLDIRDGSYESLDYQVDQPVPSDPSRDVLVVKLDKLLRPGPQDYSEPSALLSVQKSNSESTHFERAWVIEKKKDGNDDVVGMCNGLISVWISLSPGEQSKGEDWFAGSATSVRVPYPGRPDGIEWLDVYRALLIDAVGHDPNKRCIQVDKLQLVDSQGNASSPEVSLFHQPYRLEYQHNGPVRATITISVPFEVKGDEQPKSFRLYRVICLYVGANYLIEELFVRPKSEHGATDASADGQRFTVAYFSHMDMGMSGENMFRYPNVPDWFALGEPLFDPYPGYGFATNVHAGGLHRDPPDRQDWYKRFWWKTEPSTSATCLHSFMLRERPFAPGEFTHFDSRAGRNWYELIFRNLKAEPQER